MTEAELQEISEMLRQYGEDGMQLGKWQLTKIVDLARWAIESKKGMDEIQSYLDVVTYNRPMGMAADLVKKLRASYPEVKHV